jgi:hypothetical protein
MCLGSWLPATTTIQSFFFSHRLFSPFQAFLLCPFLPSIVMSPSSSPVAQINGKIDALPAAIAHKIPHLPETKEQLQADVQDVKAKSFSGLRSLVAGGFGGVCAVIVGHPFDLVKVRLQTAERGVYSGAFDVVRKSVAKNGLGRGLYAGVSAPLVGVTPMCKFPPLRSRVSGS